MCFGHRSTSEEEILVSPAFSFLNKQVVLCSLFKLLSSKVYTPNTFHFFCHSDDEQRQNTPKKQQVAASQPTELFLRRHIHKKRSTPCLEKKMLLTISLENRRCYYRKSSRKYVIKIDEYGQSRQDVS